MLNELDVALPFAHAEHELTSVPTCIDPGICTVPETCTAPVTATCIVKQMALPAQAPPPFDPAPPPVSCPELPQALSPRITAAAATPRPALRYRVVIALAPAVGSVEALIVVATTSCGTPDKNGLPVRYRVTDRRFVSTMSRFTGGWRGGLRIPPAAPAPDRRRCRPEVITPREPGADPPA